MPLATPKSEEPYEGDGKALFMVVQLKANKRRSFEHLVYNVIGTVAEASKSKLAD